MTWDAEYFEHPTSVKYIYAQDGIICCIYQLLVESSYSLSGDALENQTLNFQQHFALTISNVLFVWHIKMSISKQNLNY